MRIYRIALELVASVVKLSRRIQEHDPDLARQLKRAVVSVPLNMQEGLYSRGGNRVARFHDAMGSAKETMAGLDVSVAAEYLPPEAVVDDLERIDHIVATLWNMAGGPRR
jgi:four helix bundle protein